MDEEASVKRGEKEYDEEGSSSYREKVLVMASKERKKDPESKNQRKMYLEVKLFETFLFPFSVFLWGLKQGHRSGTS